MKTPTVGFVLGAWAWGRTSAGWEAQPVGEALPSFAQSAGDRPLVLLFEPDGIGHERIPGWYRSRTEFRESLRNRERFPVLDRASHGWGFESVHVDSPLAAETLVHTEARPRLVGWIEQANAHGGEVVAAWTLFSVCLAAGRRPGRLESATATLVATRDYLGVGCYDPDRGPCSFKSWCGPQTEQSWRSVLGWLRDQRVAVEADGSTDRGALKHLLVYSQGDVLEGSGRQPVWRERTDEVTLLGLDELAGEVVRIKRSHPANLALSFPRRFDPRPLMVAAGVGAIAVALGFGLLGRRSNAELRAERARHEQAISGLQTELTRLRANRARIGPALDPLSMVPADAAEMLARLGAALPIEASLESVEVSESGAAELKGRLAPAGTAAERHLTEGLAHAGLEAVHLSGDPVGGHWAASARLGGGADGR